METTTRRRRFLSLLLLLGVLGGLLWLGELLERRPTPLEGSAAAMPGFSPPPGSYRRSLRVELRPAQRGASIIFTTDGTTPTLRLGTRYTAPLTLDIAHPGVLVIRAVEVVSDTMGPVTTASYGVGLEDALPIVSLVVAPGDLWDADRGIFANPTFRGRDWERLAHVTYFTPESEVGFAVSAGLRMDGAELPEAPKQSLRLYFRAVYDQARLDYPLFPEHPVQRATEQTYRRLLLRAGDRTGRWTLFRDALAAETADALGLRVAQSHFARLFVNGTAWGVYRLSERVDRFFLQDNFGFRNADIVQNGRAREGLDDDWDALLDWVEGAELSDPDIYATVRAQVDLDNFTDFAILKLYFGFSPDDLYAVQPLGGRWFWVYEGQGQRFADRPDAPLALGSHIEGRDDFAVLLSRLLENPDYRAAFGARLADLLNTTLAPPAMAGRVELLTAQLSESMGDEIARWPALLGWEGDVDALETFVAARPDALREQFAALAGWPGSATARFAVEPPEGGRLFVNGVPVPVVPWEGTYFAGATLEVIAVPAPGYTFAGWEDAAGGASPILILPMTGSQQVEARFAAISAADTALRPDDVIFNEIWINDNGTSYASLDRRPIEGDWLELLVRRSGGADLRGWRITDNDTKTGRDEGSIILPQLQSLAAVPRDTVILIVATESSANAAAFPQDDTDSRDGRLLFYVGNGNLDVTSDPGFGLGTNDDNLVLLAPGPTGDFGDDVAVDFVAEGCAVTPYSCGVLSDGVTFDTPFRRLGGDDGALFTCLSSNDDVADWLVDPSACQSGDALCLDATNLLTPGALSSHQSWRRFWRWLPGR